MNLIFSTDGKGWPDFPAFSFGRLDQVEPNYYANANVVMFAFDVVDADWNEFERGGRFDFHKKNRVRRMQKAYWRDVYRHRPRRMRRVYDDPYEKAPVYRVEITAKRGDQYFDQLTQIKEDVWVCIRLSKEGDYKVDVYGGLFAEPVGAHLQELEEVPAYIQEVLTLAFDMTTWPDAPIADIKKCLSGLPDFMSLVAYDVGQGSANSLVDAAEDASVYFDLGGGVYGNAPTRPKPLRFCWRRDAPVILSHWDADHWSGEATDPHAVNRTWIVPRQSISTTHTIFAAKILASSRGRLLVWGAPGGSRISCPVGPSGTQELVLAKCSGSGRNGSGISCAVQNIHGTEGWLMTGDAGYHEIAQPFPSVPRCIVVPHHGADMGPKSVPPVPPTGYARLIYSFGPSNKHGKTLVQHPTAAGVAAHAAWNHLAWSATTPGTCVAGGHVLATASHPSTHLDGAAAGWAAPPKVPFSSVPCAGSGSGTGSCGCTGKILQN